MNEKLEINFNFGNVNPLITISLQNLIGTEDINQFLTHYKFSKWKKGRFFLKRLIRKMYKRRELPNFNWDNRIWEKIIVYQMESEIHYYSNSIASKIEDYLILNQSKNRLKDIINYKNKISYKIDLGSPLYIKGDCINALGGNVNENALFQLDGSRRLMAYLLNKKDQINIWVISLKD